MKRQQWATTNYLILLLVALYVFNDGLVAPSAVEKTILTVIIGLGLAGWGVLPGFIRRDMDNVRKQLHDLDQKFFTLQERVELGLRETSPPWTYDVAYLIVLGGTSVIGAGVVLWSIWR